MTNIRPLAVFAPIAVLLLVSGPACPDTDPLVATIIDEATLLEAQRAAPDDQVSDQALRHVVSAEGNLGIGVVHRPVIAAGGPISAIQHHRQSEVYRVMAGSGTLVTSAHMADSTPLDPQGYVVKNLTGPSDRGVIVEPGNSQPITAGDVVIIPAGVAHGFSEISEAITYMVVRIDPDRLVALK